MRYKLPLVPFSSVLDLTILPMNLICGFACFMCMCWPDNILHAVTIIIIDIKPGEKFFCSTQPMHSQYTHITKNRMR